MQATRRRSKTFLRTRPADDVLMGLEGREQREGVKGLVPTPRFEKVSKDSFRHLVSYESFDTLPGHPSQRSEKGSRPPEVGVWRRAPEVRSRV